MRLHRLFPLALALAASACGGSDSSASTDPTANGSAGVTNGTFTATINGTNWSAIGKVAVSRSANVISVAGGSLSYVVSFGAPATAAGVYPLTYANPSGSLAIVSNTSGASWSTALQGGTGTLTITTLTATHVAGTFVFDAPSASGSSNGTLHVTNGKFDVTF